MKKYFSTLMVLVALGSFAAEAQRRPGPGPRPDPRPGRTITLNPMEWGRPFLAETAPDNAVINRRVPGDVRGSLEAVEIRARQICAFYNFGEMVTYRLGYSNHYDYVTIQVGWRLERAPRDLIVPFRDGRGRVVGYASGFDSVTCQDRGGRR